MGLSHDTTLNFTSNIKKKKNGRQKGEVLFSLKPSYVYAFALLLHITQEFFRAALNTLWPKKMFSPSGKHIFISFENNSITKYALVTGNNRKPC